VDTRLRTLHPDRPPAADIVPATIGMIPLFKIGRSVSGWGRYHPGPTDSPESSGLVRGRATRAHCGRRARRRGASVVRRPSAAASRGLLRAASLSGFPWGSASGVRKLDAHPLRCASFPLGAVALAPLLGISQLVRATPRGDAGSSAHDTGTVGGACREAIRARRSACCRLLPGSEHDFPRDAHSSMVTKCSQQIGT
jgi:hypothetical protein